MTPSPLAELRAAVALLTRLPVGTTVDERTGSAAYGAVGAALGLLAGVPSALVGGRAPLLGAVLGLALVAFLTGALHLDGLADSADALAAPDADRAEAARKDPRTGSAGVAAIVLVLGAAAGSLVALPSVVVLAVTATAGAASRAVPAVAGPLLGRSARDGAPVGFGAWFAAHAGWGGAVSSLLTVVVVAIVAAVAGSSASGGGADGGGATDASTLVARLVAASAIGLVGGIATCALLRRRFGHLAGDFLGAGVEVGFAAGLAGAAIAGGLAR